MPSSEVSHHITTNVVSHRTDLLHFTAGFISLQASCSLRIACWSLLPPSGTYTLRILAVVYSWSRAAELIHSDIGSHYTRALTSRWTAREELEHLHQEMDALFLLNGDLDADGRT